MGDEARRFIHRAPRYLLNSDDDNFMRYAPTEGDSRVPQTTEMINVSETGMAFVSFHRNAPKISEIIKIEFTVPGGEQIAWFAKIIRLEQFRRFRWKKTDDMQSEPDEVLVCVQFHLLPDGHRNAIFNHLHQKHLALVKLRRQRLLNNITEWTRQHALQLVAYALATAVAMAGLYYLSRPTSSYDGQKGSPWGQRYKNN